jgi:light-regulated signal transduction histidine kinase (bacteriophytochrome)
VSGEMNNISITLVLEQNYVNNEKIIEKHHEFISVESNFENVATFSVKLPLARNNHFIT